jgi:pimeloyl-ACP methyl ester carboxylesterase
MAIIVAWSLGVLVVAAAVCLAWRAVLQQQAAAKLAIRTAEAIDEGRYIRIGGIEQWITIRGWDRRRPVVLVVDGGPGAAMSIAAPSALERDFVVVEWDQRGAGKTRGRSGPLKAYDGIDRMVGDGIEVADRVRHDLHRDKVILVGVSWGSIIGARMALARPDLFDAYVGTGQFANMQQGEAVAYGRLLAKVRLHGDAAAARTLAKSGPPPYHSQSQLGLERRIAHTYEPGAPSIAQILSQVLVYPRYSLADAWSWAAGFLESQDQFLGPDMQGPMTRTDLPALGTVFRTPVFFFQGDDDDITPAQTARAYFDKIAAPAKGYEAAPGAGHFAFLTRAQAFDAFLRRNVSPLAH